MIFGSENISTFNRTNMAIWMVLAFQGGLLNIGGLMACHSFVSHVTGLATQFGYELGKSNYGHALGVLLAPVCFLLGSVLCALLVDLQIRLRRKPKYYVVFGALFLLILFIAVGGFNRLWGEFGLPLREPREYVLLCLLCLVCGLQNALVSMVSSSVVRTTHLTGLTTDLGIGLVRVLNRRSPEDARANWMRLGLIGFFIAGSAAGYDVFVRWQFRGFLFPTVISGMLFFAALYFQVLRSRGAGRGG